MNTSEDLGKAIQGEHAETESCVQDQVTDETQHKNEVPIAKRFGIEGRWMRFEEVEEDETPKRSRRSTGRQEKGNLSDRWQASTFQDAMMGSSQKPGSGWVYLLVSVCVTCRCTGFRSRGDGIVFATAGGLCLGYAHDSPPQPIWLLVAEHMI